MRLLLDDGSLPSFTPVAVLRNSVGVPPVGFFALIRKSMYSDWLSARPAESMTASISPAVNVIVVRRSGARLRSATPLPRSVRMKGRSGPSALNSQFGDATSLTVTTPWSPLGR